jgi:Tol biopolymer transport system component
MSPEQAKGRAADKRSDIWAFGCVLYEMLARKRAFAGEDITDVITSIMRDEPDWKALPSDVPPAVRTLLERCLRKNRQDRIGDIAVARFLLDESAAAWPAAAAAAAPPEPRSKSFVPMLAASLLAAIVVGGGAWALRPSRAAAPVARFSLTLPEGQQLTTTVRNIVAISPDGTDLAFVAANRLFVRSLSEFDAHELAGVDTTVTAMLCPSFSPDGRSIAFFADGTVKRIAVTGGAAVAVCPVDPPFGITWDTTGILVGQAGKGIVRCPANGGAAETLATIAQGEQAYGPLMLPDGKTLLFTIAKGTDGAARWDKAQIVAQTLASGARKTVVSGGADARYAGGGRLLYAVGGIVFAVPFDPASQTVLGGPVPVIEGVRRANGANSGVAHFATSANGTLVYIPGPATTATAAFTIALADRTGTITPLPIAPAPFYHVRASRDGARLAIGSDDGGQAIIWIHELGATSALRRLTIVGQNRFPIWSPDGERVAFQSDREGDRGIFAQRADGTGAVVRLTKPAQDERHVPESWSPDGKVITFSSLKNNVFSLQTLTIQDGKIAPFAKVTSAEPIGSVFSPDGRWLAYYSAPTVAAGAASGLLNRGIFVQPFPATGDVYQVPKQQIDFQPLWSPKGEELFYVPTAASGQLAAVTVTTKPAVAFGSPVLLRARATGNRLSNETRAFDILPDGRFVGVVAPSDVVSTTVAPTQLRFVLNWNEELKQRVPAR